MLYYTLYNTYIHKQILKRRIHQTESKCVCMYRRIHVHAQTRKYMHMSNKKKTGEGEKKKRGNSQHGAKLPP